MTELPAKVRLHKILSQTDGIKTLTDGGQAELITGKWTNVQCHLIRIGGYWFLYFEPKAPRTIQGIIQLGQDITRDEAQYAAVQLCQYMSAQFEIHHAGGSRHAKREIRKVLEL